MSKDIFREDEIARERIATDILTNFFVEAGAGSGKTYSLVQRMVAMVEEGIDVSKICAITFTRAAAGEFYRRFQEALSEKAAENANCAKALKNIDLCFMGTIDSFCNMILSEHPAEAGVPSNANVISDEEMDTILRGEYSLIQNGAEPYGEELKEKCNRFRAMYRFPEEVFLSLLKIIMANRNADIIRVESSAEDMLASVEEPVKAVFNRLFDHPEYVYDNNKESLQAYDDLAANRLDLLGDWNEDIPELLNALKPLNKLRLIPSVELDSLGLAASGLFREHESRGKTAWYEIDQDSEYHPIKAVENIQAAAAVDLVSACVEPIAQKLKQEGNLTFFDYLLYLRDMLKADAEKDGALIRHIFERHSHFLIDEFQDTNPIQAEIFFYLSAKKPKADWRKCVPRPGSLFIVGDPKQSIYRFRSADVASFSRVKALFTGEVGEVLYLSKNFRSTHKMNQWFNNIFSELLPADTGNQSRFREIPLGEEPEDDGTFEGVYYYPSRSGTKVDESEKDPARVGNIIERLVENPDFTIREKENRGNAPIRQIQYKDFMIITPGKTRLASYIQEFTSRNIPFRIEGKVVFSDCPALVRATKIFAALAYPTENIYQFGVEDLELLQEKGYSINNLTSATLLGLIIEHYPVFSECGSENLETLFYAMELLRNAEASGRIVSLKDGADYLKRLLQDESEEERSISLQRDENKVHIANLHKVKGLEAPIVMLASPYQKDVSASVRVEHSDEKPKCWIFSMQNKNYTTIFRNNLFKAEEEKEIDALTAERVRLLYVAATRARRVLLVGRPFNAKGEDANYNPWISLIPKCEGNFFELPKGNPKVQSERKTEPVSSLFEEAGHNTIFSGSSSGEKSYQILRPSKIKVKGRSEDEDMDTADDEQVRTRIIRENPMLVGTMVHKLMETIVSSKNCIDLKATVQEILTEYEYNKSEGEKLLLNVGQTIRGGGYLQDNDVPQDILSELLSADEVLCEVPFCYQIPDDNQTAIWHGVMDVVYKKDDQWRIIDYKTNADPDELDQKYQEQMKAYVEAFEAMTGEQAEAKVYHIDV